MEESPVTTHKSRTRLSANKLRKSKTTPKQRISKQEPESPILGTPPSYPNSVSSTPTVTKDLNVSTPREEDDYRNHEIFTSSPFTVASSQMPLPGKEVFWNFDTPQAKKLREKMKAEASPVLPVKKMSMPRQRMQIAKSRREPVVSAEESERCQEVFEEFLALCKPINTSTAEESEQVQIKNENQNVDELEIKFQQSSMSPKMKGTVDEIKTEQSSGNYKTEIKTEMESIGSDMFGDDIENVSELFENNIVDSVEGDGSDLFKDDSDIPEVKHENEPSEPMELDEVEKDKIVKMSTSTLFEDDDDSLLLQCTQAAESEVKQEHQPIIKTENKVEISLNVPVTVINAKSNLQSKPIIKPFETKEVNSINQIKKPFTMPHKAVSAVTKPVSTATSSAPSVPKPFPSTKSTIPLKDITSLLQANKPVNPALETLAAEDDFGEDDSFDMLMSQMSEEDADVLGKAPVKNEPLSPVLLSKSSKRRKCFQLDKPPGVTTSPVLRNPVVPKQESSFKRFKSADDMDTKPPTKTSSLSVRRIQSSPSIPLYQMPQPAATSSSTTTSRTRQTSGPVLPTSVVQSSLRPSSVVQSSLQVSSVVQPSQGNNLALNKHSLRATGKPSVTISGKPPGAHSTSVKPPVANSSTVKPPWANSTTVKPPVANSSTVKPPWANSTTVKPPVANSSTVKPPGTNPTSVKPPGANSSTVKPPGANSSTVKPPVVNSYTVKPPGTNSISVKPPGANSTSVFKCTKEDIDRKRMEALRKRQQSQSSQK